MLLCGVLIGYTLYPVPPWLSELFNTSQLLKFIVLFMTGITAVYPVNGDELFLVFVCSALILLLFELLRQFNFNRLEKNKKQKLKISI